MNCDAGVIYFNIGISHLARLVVSAFSLRRYYSGAISLLNVGSEENRPIVSRICLDDRLNIRLKEIKAKQFRRHTAYCAKASLWRDSPYSVTLFLDTDTVVVRPIDPLLEIVADRNNPGFVVTRFSNWVTTGEIVSSRIRQWLNVECQGIDVHKLARASLDAPHPAINSGVVGWRAECGDILGRWEILTQAGHKCSFTDELAAQILILQEKHTLVSDRYNCSPIYGFEKGRVVIWHCHGKKHVQRDDGRGSEGHAVWHPVFLDAWRVNSGGIRDWAPAGDPVLGRHLPRS